MWQHRLQYVELVTFGPAPSSSSMSQLSKESTKGWGGGFGAFGGTLMLMVWLMMFVVLDEPPMLRMRLVVLVGFSRCDVDVMLMSLF
jgi:hypothetical protein